MQVAIAGSVIVHSALLFLLAWLMGLDQTARALWAAVHSAPVEQVKEEPVVTMVFPDQVLPASKLKPRLSDMQKFIRTDGNTESANKPLRTDFVSDKNTVASASKAPFPGSVSDMPTLTGSAPKPTLDLTSREAQPQKEDAPKKLAMAMPSTEANPMQPAAKAMPTVKMIESLDKDGPMVDTKLGLEVKKAVDPAQAAQKEIAMQPPADKPEAGFSPASQTATVKGSITQKGEDAVNAAATPTGKFMREVTSSVERKWHALFGLLKKDDVTPGYLRVRFYVNKQGKPEDLAFIEKIGNAAVEDMTLEAILKSSIPPIPKEILPLLDGERLLVEYDIVIQ